MKIKIAIAIIIIVLFAAQVVAASAQDEKSPTQLANERIDKGIPPDGPTSSAMERIENANKTPIDPSTIMIALGLGVSVWSIRRHKKSSSTL